MHWLGNTYGVKLQMHYQMYLIGVLQGILTCLRTRMLGKEGVWQRMLGEELAVWERMCLKLSILDAWHTPNVYRSQDSFSFSHSDRRIGGTNHSRLDRFYVGEAFVLNGGNITILPGTIFSYHAPIILRTFGQ